MQKYERDILIVGENAVDILEDFPRPIRRPGGMFYSAITACALGYKVSVIGDSGEKPNEFIDKLVGLGIQFEGKNLPSACIEYSLRNVNEILPQILVNKTKTINSIDVDIRDLKKYRAVLLYPGEDVSLLELISKQIKDDGGLVFLDIQHDIDNLKCLDKLIPLCDYIFCSRQEILRICNCETENDAIRSIFEKNAKTVVLKYGMGGSSIYTEINKRIEIPAFLSNFVCTIGAGDTYNSAFIVSLLSGDSVEDAGRKAALTASVFSEQLEFEKCFQQIRDINFDVEYRRRDRVNAHPDKLKNIKIYIAGHFLSSPSMHWIKIIRSILESKGFSVFCPCFDVGIVSKNSSENDLKRFFDDDLNGLENSTLLLALLDDFGYGGTFWEMGYAYKAGIPIFALVTDEQKPLSNMVLNSCRFIHTNLPNLLNEIFLFSNSIVNGENS